jgi:hypothetical protein
MRVLAKRSDFRNCPREILDLGFSARSQTAVTIEKEYEVHAMVLWHGVLFLQILNDLRLPAWLPAWLFRSIEVRMPPDWICNLLDEEIQMIAGPPFVAGDGGSYSRMVALEPSAVQMFWKRLDELSETEARRELSADQRSDSTDK